VKGARVLLIEDNQDSRSLMAYLLSSFGHDPLEARTGEEGVAIAAASLPDLIVCDLSLPGIDGFESLRRLRARPELEKVPIIAVTAFAMVGDRERALRAGFDGYIPKPIVPESFVGQLEAFLAAVARGAELGGRGIFKRSPHPVGGD
jgi:CheY-like chemotaxis protein